jgi:hypothetical protein
MLSNTFRMAAIAALGGTTLPLAAEPYACPGGRLLVENAEEHAPLICALSERATAQLASCNLTVPGPVTIAMADDLGEHCVGIYHCGQGRIEIMAPEVYTELRAGNARSAFAALPDDVFFESVIRHELAHAALQDMPCPFPACPVGQEYIAYTMQVMFLPEADRAAFEAAAPDEGAVSRDDLSHVMLLMAPDTFARRAWQHLNQQSDTCAFIGQIARAEVLLDRERP